MILNRIDFVNHLKCSSDFNIFFDELMSMYDIVSYCVDQSVTEISYNKNNNDNIEFELALRSEESASELKRNISCIETSKYDNQIYKLNINQNNNVLNVQLQNRVSG